MFHVPPELGLSRVKHSPPEPGDGLAEDGGWRLSDWEGEVLSRMGGLAESHDRLHGIRLTHRRSQDRVLVESFLLRPTVCRVYGSFTFADTRYSHLHGEECQHEISLN